MSTNLTLNGYAVDIRKLVDATNAKIVSRVFTLHTYKCYDAKYNDDAYELAFAHFANAAKGVCTFNDYITEDVEIEIGGVKIDTHINEWSAESKEVDYIPEFVYTLYTCGSAYYKFDSLEEAAKCIVTNNLTDTEIWKHDKRATPESGVEVNEEEYKSILEALE